jgi:hypothetical protein
MPGDVGLVAGLIHRLVSLFVNEHELPEILHRRTGDKLAAEAQATYKAWRKHPTAETRMKRDEALAALVRWSNTP